MPQKKTAVLALGKKLATTIKKSFFYMVTVFVAVAYFIHIFLPFSEPEVKQARGLINEVEDKLTLNQSNLLEIGNSLSNKEIDLNTFRSKHKELTKEAFALREQKAVLKAEYKTIRNNAKVFGFPSRHKFWWNFGIGLLITFLAVELMISARDYSGETRQAKKFGALTVGTAAGYYMAWVFFPEVDFSTNIYFAMLFVTGVLSSITAFWIINANYPTIQKLKNKITYLVDILILRAPEYVKDYEVWDVEIVEPALDVLDE